MTARTAETPLVEDLARWVLSFRDIDIPQEVMDRAKLLLLDTLGCAFAAVPTEEGERLLAAAQSMGEGLTCSVIGSPLRLSMSDAVFANSVLVRTLDLNDFYSPSVTVGHPSDVISVALGIGEMAGSSGRDVLTAIILGYELYARTCDLLESPKEWDASTKCSFCAAAMAGFLLGLDADQLADAIGNGFVHGPVLGVVRGGGQMSAAKNTASAYVNSAGAVSAVLAGHGISGPHIALDAPGGLGPNIWPNNDLREFLEPIDSNYRMMDGCFKAFPALGTGQTLIAAAISAHEELKDKINSISQLVLSFADVPKIRTQTSDAGYLNPNTRESADHSFRFLASIVLLEGDLKLSQFAERRWEDPDVRELMNKIRINLDQDLNQYAIGNFPARIRADFAQGESFSVECLYPPGDYRNFNEKVLIDKFVKYASVVLPVETCLEIRDQVAVVETASDIRGLLALTRP